MNRKTVKNLALTAGVVVLGTGCASMGPQHDYDAMVTQMMNTSFRDQGIAKVDRLVQDEANAACSKAMEGRISDAAAAAIQKAALAGVRMPSDGQFIGDWKEGEKLAQNGRGMTWTDASAAPSANGGNCYNCHQISKAEISYGTIGPSLYNYGKNRGISDVNAPTAKPIIEYTWTKMWNAKAYNACSGMPRFGHAGLLNETQLKHLMALILDPKSPVNQ